MSKEYKELFDLEIDFSMGSALKLIKRYPASVGTFMRVSKQIKKTEKIRQKNIAKGIEVPQILIVSTTDSCNLACAGCYNSARSSKEPLTPAQIDKLLSEAEQLGVGIVMLAGGEPFLNWDWITALGQRGDMLGLVFTNGTLMPENTVEWLSEHRSILPVISLEGSKSQTDARRGAGVHEKVLLAMRALDDKKIPFGVSITMTSQNFGTVLTEEFLDGYIKKGCGLFVFVEYVPVEQGSESLVLSSEQKRRLDEFCKSFTAKNAALCIPFPGDEEKFGGCLAAGRGFLHISANGDVEACPFAPFSDCNIKDVSLAQALDSHLLREIRENHQLLKEGEGGCSLWHNKQWIQDLVKP